MPEEFEEDYEARRRRRSERMEEMRRRKRKQQAIRTLIRRLAPIAGAAVVLVVLLVNGRSIARWLMGYGKVTQQESYSVADTESVSVAELQGTEPQDNSWETVEFGGGNGLNDTSVTDVTEIVNEINAKIVHALPYTDPDAEDVRNAETEAEDQETIENRVYSAQATGATTSVDEEVQSTNGIFIDLASGNILFDREAHTRINPASMTKVLTVLVAAEHIDDWSDTFEITPEITDYAYVHDCSSVGFAKNEVVTVEDLFYGTVLCSGGDAALGLATYVAGSQEAFVEMMNEKLCELQLSETAHFTNCVGLYDEDHYCTVYDIAMIMEAALDRPECREILSAHTYTTSPTAEHPEGITISNWFLRKIEDKDTGGEVICGKTGFVAQSGNCAVSYGVDASGNEYVCATVNAHSSWRCIYDHVELYKRFAQT